MKTPPIKAALALLICLLACGTAFSQRQMEDLNRGVLAVKKSSTQIYVSWRLLGDEPVGTSFNLYRSANGAAAVKLNGSPITVTTDYTDTPASLTTTAYSYFVKAVVNGIEQPASEIAALPAAAATKQHLSLPLRTDTGPNGPYDVKFAWVGDLDGDGDYDYVVDRLSTLGAYEQFLEAYTNDGVFLWRMAMGANSVNQYAYEPGSSAISIGDTDNVTVYDMDGDGRAEVLVRTANGVTVTNAAGTVVATVTAANATSQFLSVFDGLAGNELGRAAMPNPWSAHGTLTNKAMIAYLDGKRPSVVMYGYNRADSGSFYRVFTAWDYRNGAITQRWTLAQNQAVLPGSEGHQIRIADVDNDGKDEICDLGHVIDDNGTQLFHNELTHGDRFHIADINPDRPGLETYAIQQYNPTMLATAYFDSAGGGMIKKWYSGGLTDVGRGIALDINSANKGYEMYSTQPGIFNAKGQQIYANNVWAPEGLWWDGDLGREFIDGAGSGALNPVVNKFNAATGGTDRIFNIYSDNGAYSTHQAYGGRPAFWGDILGDWREEIVLVASDYSELRIYTTTVAATNRLYTLMHNPQYRCQASTKGYVQASYVDYYLGFGMASVVPPPPMIPAALTWSAGGTWDAGGSASWKNAAGVAAAFTQGDSVLFDISGSNAAVVALSGTLAPSAVSFFNPQDFTLDGTSGSLSGSMTFSKSGAGQTTLTGSHGYSGTTTIWDGALRVDGQLSNSPVTVWGGTWGGALAMGETGGRLAGTGTIGQPVKVEYRGAITPGAGMGSAGTLALGSSLTAVDGSVLAFDLTNDPTGTLKSNDRITVAGNLIVSGTVFIDIKALDGTLPPGTYTLLTYSGTLTGAANNFSVSLPEGTPYTLAVGSGALTLTVPVTRAAAALTWTGGVNANAWDLAVTANWSRAGVPDGFVSGDSVTFNAAGAANATVSLTNALPTAGVTVAADSNYTFSGNGAIAGSGGVTKSGTGVLTISTTNTYTGPTTVTGGTLAVDNLNDGGSPSSIGASSTAASNLVLNGGTLALSGLQTNTNRSLTIGASGGALSTPVSTSLQISGVITGSGALTKTGGGTLILASTNTHSGGTVISGGNLLLASDNANVTGLGSGLVTLAGGTLSMTDNDDVSSASTSSWALQVPTGSTGRLNADSRCQLAGALTGGGDFTFYTPFVRTEMDGNWSAFTGRIFVVSDSDGGNFRIRNSLGYPAAELNLGDGVYAFYNQSPGSNLTIPVGTLSGSSTAYLAGCNSASRTITWQVGARNENSTFAGIIANATGPTALTKVGAGTLTLSGASTHTGATTVSAGRLQVNGSTSGSNFTVQNGATLGGSGAITGNVTIQSGGGLEHGALAATSLAITGNLTFSANAVVRPVTGVALSAGTYTILTYSGTLAGTPTLSWEAPVGVNLVATFSTSTAGVIAMTLAPPARGPGPITWTGAVDFNWDAATANWTASSAPTSYQAGDTPWFTDSGIATSAINLVANAQPAGIVVDASKDYTFSGTGAITGPATIGKSGTGTLVLTGVHAVEGAVAISGGTLSVTQTGTGNGAIGAVLGSGPITLSGGGAFRMGSANGKNFPANAIAVPSGSAGTLSSASLSNGYGGALSGAADSALTISGAVSMGVSGSAQFSNFAGTVVIPSGSQLRFSSTSGPNGNGGANTTFEVNGLLNTRNAGGAAGAVLGALTGSGSLQGQSNTTAGTVIYNVGAKNIDSTFSGAIANGGNGTATVNKTGSGNLTLAGVSTYTGTTTVSAGKLTVTGSLAATATTVAAAGTLGGSGSIAGAVTCNGTLAPGVSAGTLTLSSGLVLASTSTLEYQLGTASDLTAVTGNLTLDGTVNVSAAAGFAPGTYTLFTYTGTLANNTLAVGSLPAGHTASISTATANQVRLIIAASNTPPQITAGPTASAGSVTTTTTALAVTAIDNGGEAVLNYAWSATGPATVAFSPNGTNAAKNSTATFSHAGSYTLTVTVTDAQGLSTTGSVPVTVTATATAVATDPPSATLAVNASQTFTATVSDQFGNPMSASVSWSASGGGTIAGDGLFSATSVGGPFNVSASVASLSASASVVVTKAPATVTLGTTTLIWLCVCQ